MLVVIEQKPVVADRDSTAAQVSGSLDPATTDDDRNSDSSREPAQTIRG